MSSAENDPKRAEEMSLAELLGHTEAISTPTNETPEEESDDDKSGLINLSQMAAMLSAPPPPRMQEPAVPAMPQQQAFSGGMPVGSYPPAQQRHPSAYPARASMPPADAYADVAQPKKKSPMAIIVIAAIAVIAGGIGAFVAMSGGDDDKSASSTSGLEQEVAQASSNVATEAAPAAPTEAAAPVAAATADATPGNQEDAANTGTGDGADEYEITEEEIDDGKGGKQRRKVKRLKRTTAKTAKSAQTAPTVAAATPTETKTATSSAPAATTKTAPAAATPSATGKGSKTSALDSLLSGGGGGSSADSGGLPQKPSRGDVQKAMSDVAGKARGVCGKSGSGQVSVRIIVGSNGVVRDAIPLGDHSADSLGRCVATFARRTARLPAFKAPTFTFTYPFNI